MSIIKSIKQVLGLHNAASENHFWDGSTANQLSLKRGTPDAPGAEVMKVNAGVVSFPNQLQTWATQTRVSGTQYTNSTGQPITVNVIMNLGGSGVGNIVVAGITVASFNGNSGTSTTISFTVPNGASYTITAGTSNSISSVAELR